jgi:hypothetical protein
MRRKPPVHRFLIPMGNTVCLWAVDENIIVDDVISPGMDKNRAHLCVPRNAAFIKDVADDEITAMIIVEID